MFARIAATMRNPSSMANASSQARRSGCIGLSGNYQAVNRPKTAESESGTHYELNLAHLLIKEPCNSMTARGKAHRMSKLAATNSGSTRGPILPVWMQIGIEVVGGVSVIDSRPLALGDGFEAPAHNPVDTETAGGGHGNR